ncbi:CoA ester lyase [Microaerobacter geothermalis]|uniref:HpcH/HpaI aldolase/citrate lyase family protein n=1 Tax=Microaerobacter geothermalis TaxID=674972 RepID=UPI001F33E992|nr:CoA ester lyase [Microaerobacter geothermalis]MCF6094022.1 CoA ester lyase [Microaerobacter geothermalis]
MRNIRSYLFVPATDIRIIEKAIRSQAEAVIIDLEDALALGEKEQGREIASHGMSLAREKPIFVRINDVTTPFWEKDLECAVRYGASGIVLPKAERGEDVRKAGELIRSLLSENRTFEILPIIESAVGVEFAFEIASSEPMISRLAFGSIDFSLDIGSQRTGEGTELLYARSRIVIASRAAKLNPPIDSVYPDIHDSAGLQREANHAKQLGYKGKLTIHPKQLDVVHSVFSYSEQELKEAKEIVAAFEEAEKNGIAAISVKGKMVDYPVYKQAKAMLNQKL